MPSSPKGPCRIGNTTSMSPSAVTVPSGSTTVSSRVAGESGQRTRVPLSATVGQRLGVERELRRVVGLQREGAVAGDADRHHVVPSRSIAARTPPAVAQLIECSLERPPKSTTTWSGMGFSGIVGTGVLRDSVPDRSLALRLVGLGEVRRDVARIQRTGEHLADLLTMGMSTPRARPARGSGRPTPAPRRSGSSAARRRRSGSPGRAAARPCCCATAATGTSR